MADKRADYWIERAQRAFGALTPMFMLYDALGAIFYPERQDFLSNQPTGIERYAALADGYPSMMRRDLANQLGSMLRRRGAEWFKCEAIPRHLNTRSEVAAWCDDSTDTQRQIVYAQGGQFSRTMSVLDNDYVTFGTAVGTTTYNRAQTGVLYRPLHLKTIAMEENAEGVVDLMYEKPVLPARKWGQMFKDSQLSALADLKKAIDKEPSKDFEFLRVVCPIDEYDDVKRLPKGAKWLSLYIEPTKRLVISENFFFTFPYWVRRWSTVSGEVMGRSPATMVALADGRMSQSIRSSLMEAIEKAIDPPAMVASDGVIGDLNFYAGGATMTRRGYDYRTGKPVEFLQTGTMPNYGMEFTKDNKEMMAQAFFVNLLRRMPEKEMTASEAAIWNEQYVAEAAPIFEPMENENADLMARTRDLAERAGAFETRPETLQAADVGFDFDTPISQALAKLRVAQGQQVMATTEGLAKFDQGAVRRVDWVQVQKDMMKGLGPSKWMVPDEQANPQIEGDQEQKQAESLMAMAKNSGIMDMLTKNPQLLAGEAAPPLATDQSGGAGPGPDQGPPQGTVNAGTNAAPALAG